MRQVRRSSSTTPASVELLATAITADAIHHDEVDNAVHPRGAVRTNASRPVRRTTLIVEAGSVDGSLLLESLLRSRLQQRCSANSSRCSRCRF